MQELLLASITVHTCAKLISADQAARPSDPWRRRMEAVAVARWCGFNIAVNQRWIASVMQAAPHSTPLHAVEIPGPPPPTW